MFTRLIVFLRALFAAAVRRIRGTATELTAQVQVAAETTPAHQEAREMQSHHDRQRSLLRALLLRTDGGGLHHGSKRAIANHRGSQRGKRSGRS